MNRITLLLLILFCGVTGPASAKAQQWFTEATLLTGYYKYNASEVRQALPSNFQAGLDNDDLIDQDDDLVNYSISAGYHINDDLLVKATFVDGVDLDPLFQDFCLLICSDDDLTFNLDMHLFELDTEFTFHRFTPELSAFVGMGLVLAKLDGNINQRQDTLQTTIVSVDQSETGLKGVIGLNWAFSDSFSLILGHQRHSMFDMTKTYLSLLYNF